MAKFEVPLRVEVPAYGSIEVEADSYEEACTKVQADIDEHGFVNSFGEVDYTVDWVNASMPQIRPKQSP